MSIYKLRADYENHYSFLVENAELFSKMPSFSAKFKAKTRAQEWVMPNGSFFQSENYKIKSIKIPDITIWLLGTLVLNKKAKAALGGFLTAHGEFLPVNCEGARYYIFNCLAVIPDEAIDTKNTKETMQNGIPMGLESLAFYEEQTTNFPIFKTNADKLASLYCNEDFRSLYSASNISGINFEKDLIKA